MKIVLSPAKSLDIETPPTTSVSTVPGFLEQSAELVEILKAFSPAELASLMKISDKLATLNVARYAEWSLPFTPDNAKQAMLCFTGDVYKGLDACTLDQQGLDYAQQHIRILSGLYGILKPLDLIQPYRLEMGCRLKNPKGKDLYSFWGEQIQKTISDEMADEDFPVLINLASKEYFTSLKLDSFQHRVITPIFKDWKNGQYKHINFYAKKARGLMSRFAVDKQVENPEDLKQFDYEGYQFDDKQSDDNNWVYLRRQ